MKFNGFLHAACAFVAVLALASAASCGGDGSKGPSVDSLDLASFGSNPWVQPMPVAVIGSYDAAGNPNAMTAAWVGQFDRDQLSVSLVPHASTQNILRSGCFTVGFATTQTMVAADYVGIVSANDDKNKMANSGLMAVKAPSVNAPLFRQFPMTLECTYLKTLDSTNSGFNFIAKIVNVVVDSAYLDANGKPDIAKMQLITFDQVHNGYIELGQPVADAFKAGRELIK